MLDTHRAVETPEGVALRLRVAGPAVRGLAWGIDIGLRTVAYIAILIPLAAFGTSGFGIFLLISFAGEWLYPVLFEARRGATPGKKVMGLRVLNDNGTPVGWAPAALRNLLRFADFLPMAYGFGLLSMLLHPEFKRLGDLAAGTVVVHWEGGGEEAEGWDAAGHPPMPPPVPLTAEERRTVIDFADRVPTLTPQRAGELAAIARPLTRARGQEGIDRLLAMARWLWGHR